MRRVVLLSLNCLMMAAFAFAAEGKKESLVAPGAEFKKIATGYTFVEGIRFDHKGDLYFSEVVQSKIFRIAPDGKLTLFRENANNTNGRGFDKHNLMINCEQRKRRLSSINLETGEEKVVADSCDGKPLNVPNDLWIDPQDGIYFTNPKAWENEMKFEPGPCYVYYVTPDRKKVLRATGEGMVLPNGIIGTKDGKKLYVGDFDGKKSYVFDIKPGGMLGPRRLFADQGSDGMTLDERGNVYLTYKEYITIYSPEGKVIEKIKPPETVWNLVFGGKGGKTLYMTCMTSVYTLRMNVRGQ